MSVQNVVPPMGHTVVEYREQVQLRSAAKTPYFVHSVRKMGLEQKNGLTQSSASPQPPESALKPWRHHAPVLPAHKILRSSRKPKRVPNEYPIVMRHSSMVYVVHASAVALPCFQTDPPPTQETTKVRTEYPADNQPKEMVLHLKVALVSSRLQKLRSCQLLTRGR